MESNPSTNQDPIRRYDEYPVHKVRDIYYELEDLFSNLNYDVVVVEDDSTTTEFIKAVGYATNETSRIKSFPAAEEAYHHLKSLPVEKSPDLIIVDIHLKGEQDGFWLCEKLYNEFPATRVVLISSTNPILVRKRLQRMAVEAQYLQKPFTINQIAKLFEDFN